MKVHTEEEKALFAKAKEMLSEGETASAVMNKLKIGEYQWMLGRKAGLIPTSRMSAGSQKIRGGEVSGPKPPRVPRLVNVAVDESPASADGHVTVVVIKTPTSQLAQVLSQI